MNTDVSHLRVLDCKGIFFSLSLLQYASFSYLCHTFKHSMKPIQHHYIFFLGCLVLVLALIRCMAPSIASPTDDVSAAADSIPAPAAVPLPSDTDSIAASQITQTQSSEVKIGDIKHPVIGVSSYREEFPDTNDLQLTSAQQWGVEPVIDRENAENRKMELVYVGASPYYRVAKLKNSIPYLVPRASILLQDIGRAYYDSLVVKGLPLHQFIVTSILRTSDDVQRLRRSNRNATENSCHLYGTTFDIAYNKYEPLTRNGKVVRREVPSDTLKWVLSEVLRDMRNAKRCYIKYEVKQGCFHVTTR